MCHLCQHGISISGIKWTVSKEICRLSGTTHAHHHGNAGTLWVLLLSKLPFPSGQILGTSLPHCHQWASPGSLYLLSTPSLLFFFLASQLPLSKLDFCQRPSHAALVCIPLPVQPTVPEVDGFQVGANLHPHLGYGDECSRPVMTPPTPAGIEINCDTRLIIEPRERMFEHVKVSCHHLCILQPRLAWKHLSLFGMCQAQHCREEHAGNNFSDKRTLACRWWKKKKKIKCRCLKYHQSLKNINTFLFVFVFNFCFCLCWYILFVTFLFYFHFCLTFHNVL